MLKLFERISDLEEGYYVWARYEKRRMESTVEKHKVWIRDFKKEEGDLIVRRIQRKHFDDLKAKYYGRKLSQARIAGVLYAMRSFLAYCRDEKKMRVMNLAEIKVPPQKRDYVVNALSKEEVQRAVEAIEVTNEYLGKKKQQNINIRKLRWKCYLEVKWSSGMRLSEMYSLNRNTINLDTAEGEIIGKGGKARRIFVSQKACQLIREYLAARQDNHEALFVSHLGGKIERWSKSATQNYLERWRSKAKLSKHVTTHTFRKTFGTIISYEHDIFAACEMLGHRDIQTTKRHYTGTDWRRLKDIHHSAIA
jgi:integrase/recombinase XerC